MICALRAVSEGQKSRAGRWDPHPTALWAARQKASGRQLPHSCRTGSPTAAAPQSRLHHCAMALRPDLLLTEAFTSCTLPRCCSQGLQQFLPTFPTTIYFSLQMQPCSITLALSLFLFSTIFSRTAIACLCQPIKSWRAYHSLINSFNSPSPWQPCSLGMH